MKKLLFTLGFTQIFHLNGDLVRKNLFYQRSEKNQSHLTGDETFFHIADEIRACVINRHLGGIFGFSKPQVQRGYTLIGLLVVLVFLGAFIASAIGIYQQTSQFDKTNKAGLEMGQWLEAAQAFHFDTTQWPKDLQELSSKKYMPPVSKPVTPWDSPITATQSKDKKQFSVSATFPSHSIALRIANMLPNVTCRGKDDKPLKCTDAQSKTVISGVVPQSSPVELLEVTERTVNLPYRSPMAQVNMYVLPSAKTRASCYGRTLDVVAYLKDYNYVMTGRPQPCQQAPWIRGRGIWIEPSAKFQWTFQVYPYYAYWDNSCSSDGKSFGSNNHRGKGLAFKATFVVQYYCCPRQWLRCTTNIVNVYSGGRKLSNVYVPSQPAPPTPPGGSN